MKTPTRQTPSLPRWRLRLSRDRWVRWTAGALAALTVLAVAGPWVSPYTESEMHMELINAGPSAAHWMGNDSLGRDMLTRVFYGGRISLAVGVFGALLSLAIGVTVGGIAGMAGGRTEAVIMRLIDFLYGIPLLLIVIGLQLLEDQPGLKSVFVALGLVYWLQMARMVRSRVAELRNREFADAARALGAGPARVFIVHILPNTIGVIVVTATFMIPQAIFAESFLSFLGLGVADPSASWGTLASEGLGAMRAAPHQLAFPAAAICLTMFLFQSLGESLRSALAPREIDE